MKTDKPLPDITRKESETNGKDSGKVKFPDNGPSEEQADGEEAKDADVVSDTDEDQGEDNGDFEMAKLKEK